ncbi:hypothetical protein THRCLA_04721 [Thraustotheca clavata]|uniref:Uncharacterized protein n=1 Tax=Thraustotheca clavata TaxID=74557 RepID=A0A1V9ZYU5_9STRA|nr:hypothetical protein THRCLA_04721 [Thraustotheca clavata]
MWSSESEEDYSVRDSVDEQEASQVQGENDPGHHVGQVENMEEEMQAMKSVFLRMSEKKARQKDQGLQDCVRVYVDAFQKDVEQIHIAVKKKRTLESQNLGNTIQETKDRLDNQKRDLSELHNTYETAFNAGIERVEQALTQLGELRKKIVCEYDLRVQRVHASFDEASKKLDLAVSKLEDKSNEILSDIAYLRAFHAEVDRLITE